MRTVDVAIDVLRLSRDGALLSPGHLALVQAAAAEQLSDAGVEELQALHEQLCAGQYEPPWLFGIQYLTRDHEGNVYWKGKCVEHFSHMDEETMRASAQRLAMNCELLESKGFPVNSRTAISQEVLDAPADTPWLEALCRYYVILERGDSVRVILFKHDGSAIALEKRNGKVMSARYDEANAAYHAACRCGYVSADHKGSYHKTVALLERSLLTPEEIHAALQ